MPLFDVIVDVASFVGHRVTTTNELITTIYRTPSLSI